MADGGGQAASDSRSVPGADRSGELRTSLVLAVLAGIVASSYLPLAVGGVAVNSTVGLLWPAVVLGLLLTIVVRCVSAPGGPRSRMATVGGMLVATLLLVFVAPLIVLPPFARDELVYHLALPKLYAQAGRVLAVPFCGYSYYPQLVQMLYTPLIAHGLPSAAKLLHLAFGLAAAAILYEYLSARVRPAIAGFVALALLTTPTVAILASTAYVDLALLLYVTVGLVALLGGREGDARWRDGRSEDGRVALVIAGLAAGLCGATKYSGLPWIVLMAAGVVVLSPRRGNVPRNLLVFAAAAALPLLPWMLRNAVLTGNPFHPMFGTDNEAYNPAIGALTKRHLLYGESWLEILLTPVRVFVTGVEGDPRRFDGVLQPLFLFGFFSATRRERTPRDLFLAGGAVLYLLTVLIGSPFFVSRFVVPVLAPLAILSAEALNRIDWETLPRAGAIALVALVAGFSAPHLVVYLGQARPFAYLAGVESADQFLARHLPEYEVVQFANEHLPAGSTVYLAMLGSRGYYWNRRYVYDDNLLATTLVESVRSASDAFGVEASLRSRGIDAIAASDALLARYLERNLTEDERDRWRAFESGMQAVKRAHGVSLYRLSGGMRTRVRDSGGDR